MSSFVGFIAGAFIAMTCIALFSDKLPITVVPFTLPLAVSLSWLTWKVIKTEEKDR